MATAFLVPMPRAVFYDAVGNPLVGGAVSTFVPGGTVPKTTWQDAGETTPNSNPITLDGDGSCLLYGSGDYQLTVTDALGNAVPAYSGLTGSLAASAGISDAMAPIVGASSVAVAGRLLGLPSVENIAALRLLTTATATSPVFVQGYYVGADGGEGIFWVNPSDTTSTDNSGTIIVDASGRRWYRETEGQPLNILWFGGAGNGTEDNLAAWNAMASVATSRPNGARVVFPAGGKYLFSTQTTFAFPAVIPAFNLEVEAHGATLYWPNASGGILLAASSPMHTISFNGGRLTTGVAGGGSGISTTQSAPLNAFSQNVFRDMVFCGDNNTGQSGSNYWTICADPQNLSNVNFECCSFLGAGTTSGDGLHFSGTGPYPGDNFGLICNVSRCWFFQLATCVVPGPYQQALTIEQSFMVGSANGVFSPVESADNLEMLTVIGCDIECTDACVALLTNIPFVEISSNLAVIGGENNAAVWLPNCGGAQIVGNFITANTLTGTIGVFIGGGDHSATNPGSAVVTGNILANVGTGVSLGTFSASCNVQSNIYAGCTTDTEDFGTGNTIGGGSP